MAAISSALVLNIGTLTTELVEVMKIDGETANAKKIPIVFDAVGAGATKFRDDKTAELLKELRIDIIKGNSSEIATEHSFGPGTFKQNFYDALYNLNEQEITKLERLEKVK